jgi:hypothetical protein
MRRIRRSKEGITDRARGLFALGWIASVALAAGVGMLRTDAQEAFPLPAIDPPGANAGPPGAKAGSTEAQPVKPQAGPTAEDASRPEVVKQCADLLKMAAELKTAVDRSSAGTLSVTVVRKAGEIEQLAHKVRAANGKG